MEGFCFLWNFKFNKFILLFVSRESGKDDTSTFSDAFIKNRCTVITVAAAVAVYFKVYTKWRSPRENEVPVAGALPKLVGGLERGLKRKGRKRARRRSEGSPPLVHPFARALEPRVPRFSDPLNFRQSKKSSAQLPVVLIFARY